MTFNNENNPRRSEEARLISLQASAIGRQLELRIPALMDPQSIEITFFPKIGDIPIVTYPVELARRMFQRAVLTVTMDRIDLDLDEQMDGQFARFVKGETSSAKIVEDDICPDGHKMQDRHGQMRVCRLEDPPLIRWIKPLTTY